MQKIIDRINHIQQKMKAPKDKTNEFGGFAYRNAEDILHAMKPHMGGAIVVCNFEVIRTEDNWHYVKANVTIFEGDQSFTVAAFAREPMAEKGKADAMVTGSSQSYAQKYALASLCGLSGASDADDENNWDNEVEAYHQLIKAAQAAPQSDRDAECVALFMFTDGYEVESKRALYHAYMDAHSIKGKKGKLQDAIKALNDYGFAVLENYRDSLIDATSPEEESLIRSELSDEQIAYVDSMIESKLAGA